MPAMKKTPAVEKARNTDWWTEILFKALTSRVAKRWRLVSFRGTGGGEWRGIVDLLAIRKDTSRPDHDLLKRGDLFEIMLVQMKGGSARNPSDEEIKRLQAVKRHYGAKEIVLFNWRREEDCKFSRLSGGKWTKSSAKEIFG